MSETLISDANSGIAIKQMGTRFDVFLHEQPLDRFTTYKAAASFATDLYVAKCASADDELIGQKRFIAAAVGNGGNVIVMSKTKHGYIVQRIGSPERFEVVAEYLLDPVE